MELETEKLLKLGMNARKIVEAGKGLIAADESAKSIQSRMDRYGIENTSANRQKFREIMITSPGISDKVGGIILNEETFVQKTHGDRPLVDIIISKGISPGIKLDKGLVEFGSGEFVSVGLEDLDKRCKQDIFMKAEFAKWRCLFKVSDTLPTKECVYENSRVLAEYAKICQSNGIVPIVEPELLWDGDYSMERAYEVQKFVISALVHKMNAAKVYIPGVLLKPSFVTPGKDSTCTYTHKNVASATFSALISTVPAGLPGVVFLSGGHSPEDANEFLNSVNNEKGKRTWNLSFSFGRTLGDCVLDEWKGIDKNIRDAQKAFHNHVNGAFLAASGKLHGGQIH